MTAVLSNYVSSNINKSQYYSIKIARKIIEVGIELNKIFNKS